jgi:hypothetical protein
VIIRLCAGMILISQVLIEALRSQGGVETLRSAYHVVGWITRDVG